MFVHLPSLHGMRVFEAAARHACFARAAEELFVTPAAVSYQIKTLEEQLGLPLFRRLNKAVSLTAEGHLLFAAVRNGLAQMAEGVRLVTESALKGELNVSVVPSFARQWLIPRLDGFYRACPDIVLRLNATQRLSDFKSDGNHLAIRFCAAPAPDLLAERLMEEHILAVASPALLARHGPVASPGDLLGMPLLHDASLSWRDWLAALAVPATDVPAGPAFDDANLCLLAAERGHGVTLTRRSLAAGEIEAGRLAMAFDARVPARSAYFLVCPPGNRKLPKVAGFWDWVMAEAREAAPALSP